MTSPAFDAMVGVPAGSIPPSPRSCSSVAACASPGCSCRTGTTTARASVALKTTAATRLPSAAGSAFPSIRATSPANTGRGCSSTSSPSTAPAARPIPTCCATARSSSAPSSMKPAPGGSASPPATTPAWPKARPPLRAVDAPRTRPSCTRQQGRWLPPCFPSVNSKAVRSHARPAFGAREEGFHRHLFHRRTRFRDFLGQYILARPARSAPSMVRIGRTRRRLPLHRAARRLEPGGVRGRPQAPWFVVGKDVTGNVPRRSGPRQPVPATSTPRASQGTFTTDARAFSHRQDPLRQPDEPRRVEIRRWHVEVRLTARSAVTPTSVVFTTARNARARWIDATDALPAPYDSFCRSDLVAMKTRRRGQSGKSVPTRFRSPQQHAPLHQFVIPLAIRAVARMKAMCSRRRACARCTRGEAGKSASRASWAMRSAHSTRNWPCTASPGSGALATLAAMASTSPRRARARAASIMSRR